MIGIKQSQSDWNLKKNSRNFDRKTQSCSILRKKIEFYYNQLNQPVQIEKYVCSKFPKNIFLKYDIS